MLNLNKQADNLFLFVAFLVSISFNPLFVESLMLIKFLIIVTSSCFLLIIISTISRLQLKQYGVPIILVFIWAIALFLSVLNSEQSIYESLIGIWGRYNGFFTYISLATIFLYSIIYYRKNLPEKFLQVLVYLGFFHCIIGLCEVFNIFALNYLNKDPYTKLTLGNSNFASISLVVTLIAAITKFLVFKNLGKFHKVLILISIFIQIGLIITTRAFQGLITLVISMVLIGFYFYNLKQIRLKLKNKIYFFAFFLSLFGILSFVISRMKILNFDSLYDRFYIWIAAWQMAQDNFLFGVGLDSFGKWFPLYKQEGTLKYENLFENYDSAHNIYLNFFANGGFILLSAFIVLQSYIFYKIFWLFKNKMMTPNLFGIFCIWLVVQLQSLVSIDHIAISIWGWLAGGILCGKSFEKTEAFTTNQLPILNFKNLITHKKSVLNISLSIIFLITPFLIYMYPTVISEYQIQKNINFYKNFNKQKEINNLNSNLIAQAKIVNLNLFNTCIELRSEDLRNYGSAVLFNSGEDQYAFRLTFDTLKRFPRSINARALLAQVYERDGDLDKARKYYFDLLELDPKDQLFKSKIEKLG